MASEYCNRWSNSPVTLMRQRLLSVLTSYSSPTTTVLAALVLSPLNFTFPLSQASAACDLVLNRRIDQRYLSRRSFSFSGMIGTGIAGRAVKLKRFCGDAPCMGGQSLLYFSAKY